jgi:hypothetical protein
MWLRDLYEFGTLGQVVMGVLLTSAHGHLSSKGTMSLSAGAAGNAARLSIPGSRLSARPGDHWGFPSSIGFATAPLYSTCVWTFSACVSGLFSSISLLPTVFMTLSQQIVLSSSCAPQ